MVFRQAKDTDAKEIMSIIVEAQAYLKREGINQWQNGYPNLESVYCDISKGKAYVIVANEQIIASAALSFNDEKTYDAIYEGQWINEGSYGVIHRVAVAEACKGSGIAGRLFEHLERMCKANGAKSIKIDTHEHNKSMQRLLEKLEFQKCGIIYLADGNKRIAFEKLIENAVQ